MREPPAHEFTGIGLTDKSAVMKPFCPFTHLRARSELFEACDALLIRHYLSPLGEHLRWIDKAAGHIEEAANLLGYDLVRRLTPSEAHAEAIARRVREEPVPITSAPGFDGRARHVGADDRDNPTDQVLR